jgi:hypothetical protein
MTAVPGVEARCPYCGEVAEIAADPSGGSVQEYVEDCPVCCRPWCVRIVFDEWGDPSVELRREGE